MRGSATHTVLPKEGGGTKGRCAGRQRREVEPHEPHGQATDHMPSVIESASLAANRSFACASELSPYWTVATFVLKMCYENSCERCLFFDIRCCFPNELSAAAFFAALPYGKSVWAPRAVYSISHGSYRPTLPLTVKVRKTE